MIPVDARRADWPRLVSQANAEHARRLRALESTTLVIGVRSISATGAVNAGDYLVLVNATAGAVTVNLPAAASSAGRVLVVKKTDASGNAVTVDPNAAETIDGTATQAITGQYDAVAMICDGAGWWIV